MEGEADRLGWESQHVMGMGVMRPRSGACNLCCALECCGAVEKGKNRRSREEKRICCFVRKGEL